MRQFLSEETCRGPIMDKQRESRSSTSGFPYQENGWVLLQHSDCSVEAVLLCVSPEVAKTVGEATCMLHNIIRWEGGHCAPVSVVAPADHSKLPRTLDGLKATMPPEKPLPLGKNSPTISSHQDRCHDRMTKSSEISPVINCCRSDRCCDSYCRRTDSCCSYRVRSFSSGDSNGSNDKWVKISYFMKTELNIDFI